MYKGPRLERRLWLLGKIQLHIGRAQTGKKGFNRLEHFHSCCMTKPHILLAFSPKENANVHNSQNVMGTVKML